MQKYILNNLHALKHICMPIGRILITRTDGMNRKAETKKTTLYEATLTNNSCNYQPIKDSNLIKYIVPAMRSHFYI